MPGGRRAIGPGDDLLGGAARLSCFRSPAWRLAIFVVFESESSDILWRLVFWLFFGIWSASRRKPVSDSTQTVGGRPEAMLFPESPIPLN